MPNIIKIAKALTIRNPTQFCEWFENLIDAFHCIVKIRWYIYLATVHSLTTHLYIIPFTLITNFSTTWWYKTSTRTGMNKKKKNWKKDCGNGWQKNQLANVYNNEKEQQQKIIREQLGVFKTVERNHEQKKTKKKETKKQKTQGKIFKKKLKPQKKSSKVFFTH